MRNSEQESRLTYFDSTPLAKAGRKAVRSYKRLISSREEKAPMQVFFHELAISDPSPQSREEFARLYRDVLLLLFGDPFRFHEGGNDVFEDQLLEFRADLDNALEGLQLIELGIECGYYELEVFRDRITQGLSSLLADPASHKFLANYDYLGVRFVAARIDFKLELPQVEPPRSGLFSETHFAAFLSQHNAWLADKPLRSFLDLLDDIQLIALMEHANGEAGALAEYIESGELPALARNHKIRFRRNVLGYLSFVERLSSLFEALPEDQHAYFGYFYAYWMARFLGLRKGPRRWYEPVSVEWSQLAQGKLFTRDRENLGEMYYLVDDLSRQIDIIRTAWSRTAELLLKYRVQGNGQDGDVTGPATVRP